MLSISLSHSEPFASLLEHSAAVIQNLADLVAKKYGAACSILLVGPHYERPDDIVMKRYVRYLKMRILSTDLTFLSCHAGLTKTVMPMSWPEFEPEQFAATSKSMVRFGQRVFGAYSSLYCHCQSANLPTGVQPPPSSTPPTPITATSSSAATHQDGSVPDISLLNKARYRTSSHEDVIETVDLDELCQNEDAG